MEILKSTKKRTVGWNLSRRYEGVARAIQEIKAIIETDPDSSSEVLISRVNPIATENQLTEAQIKFIREAVGEYEEKHRAIKKYRDMYPDDNELFKMCFGREPHGRVTIVEGPLTLHFRCFNVDDYVLAGRGEDEDKIKPEDRAWLEKTAALAVTETRLKDLGRGTVSIENVTWNMEVSKPKGREETAEELEKRAKEYGERSRLHEEQHQFNRLFKPIDTQKSNEELISDFKNRKDYSQESVRHLIRNLVKSERVFIEEKLWDEVLALYRGGRKRAEDVYKNLQGEVYDYRERHKVRISKVSEWVQKHLSEISEITVETKYIEKEIDNVFGSEYEADLQKWLSAITVLENKGYSSDEVIAFLFQEPIHNWPKLADRVSAKQIGIVL